MLESRGRASLIALVTGGAGLVGSHFVTRLSREGHEVGVLDNFWRGHTESWNHSPVEGSVSFVLGDARDEKSGFRCIKFVDLIVHLASFRMLRKKWVW